VKISILYWLPLPYCDGPAWLPPVAAGCSRPRAPRAAAAGGRPACPRPTGLSDEDIPPAPTHAGVLRRAIIAA
jgi:hypothetical protein